MKEKLASPDIARRLRQLTYEKLKITEVGASDAASRVVKLVKPILRRCSYYDRPGWFIDIEVVLEVSVIRRQKRLHLLIKNVGCLVGYNNLRKTFEICTGDIRKNLSLGAIQN
jgi:hypothetical protein